MSLPPPPPPVGPPAGQPVGPPPPVPAAAPVSAPDEWQRLDRRMLLVHPVREVGRFVVPLVVFFVAGTFTGSVWQYLFIVVPVAVGVARYLTTRYRVAGGRVELRRGLLSKHTLSTPVERVRTVDLTASPVHRVLGLTTVRIGTGTASTDGNEQLDLDGLPTPQAHALRAELLRLAEPEPDPAAGPSFDGAVAPPSAARAERVAAVFDLGWLRFAPFTSGGLVIAAAILGAGGQLLGSLDLSLHPDEWSLALPLALVVAVGLVALALGAAVLSVIGYLLTNWGFRLSHSAGSWHVRRGLLTTRDTSVDDERLAGVSLGQPLGLRWARGSRVSAIVTGLRSEQGGSSLLPPAPRAVADAAAAAVLGTDGPVRVPLVPHGPAAVRRRFVRALVPALVVLAATILLTTPGPLPGWTPVVGVVVVAASLGLAVDRSRGLGHALVEGHVVARSGSLLRDRDMLGTDHVIGWNLRATFFQRRLGLTTLMATTAGGSQSVTILDVPEPLALELATGATPALLRQFAAVPQD